MISDLSRPASPRSSAPEAPPAVREITLPTVKNPLGDLTFVEAEKLLPFKVRRVYYVYDVPQDAQRGGHANKTNHAVIIAVAGGLTLTIEDQQGRIVRKRLDNPTAGLYYPPLHWIDMSDFAPGTVCLVIASNHYDRTDYLRDYKEFKAFR
jgi:hypothetical protein